jgi:acyl transferase domain-containing protein/thioesterase domain-containing protein/acyl carrier protein
MNDVEDSDIAIVGMALRVPGAATPEAFWANLVNGVDSLRTYTEDELLARGVSRSALADPNYVRGGMPLDGVDAFDPEFFGFSAKEAAILDPQHRQFYEVAWEALERAGHPPSRFDGAIGVFAGSGMAAYFAQNILTNPDLVKSVGLFLLRHTGNDKDFLATRVSYAFDLQGPSVNVQTACSTSLVATHLAVQSLLSGETDMALAGGVTIELPHDVGYFYKEGEILSPDGHCRTFDHRSKGTVFGSGAGVVVLRRLADALESGDHIHAVIKGSAVNNDGSGKVGYLAPSVEGQAAAIAEALAVADVEAGSIEYVECHGTGTPVGDPIEISALTQAFRESADGVGFCRVGSVKSNIGHLDTAAGVASLIKASLALEKGCIPASLNFEAPNPQIAFEGSPFLVADQAVDWSRSTGPRRAGVNSLGVGGTNAFVVLQEPPARPAAARDEAPQLFVLSARTRKALDEAGPRLAAWLRDHTHQPLADIAWTLLEGRESFEQRRVFAAASHEDAARVLESGDARRLFTHVAELDRPSIVFMYPGGGAQYFGMGQDLYRSEPVFQAQIDAGLGHLRDRLGVDLAPVFHATETEREACNEALAKPSVQLPLIFLVEYALTKLWLHYGVEPEAVFGHSMGENTAACVSGVISFEDALGLVLLRGQLMDEVPQGGMLSVPLPVDELLPLLGEDLDLAASNSPSLSVASGPSDRLDALAASLAEQGVDTQRVRINIAAHSRLLDGILDRFRDYLLSITLRPPKIPIVSNRTGDWLDPARAQDPEYWVEHLRRSVLFAAGVDRMLERDDRVFLEVGPGATLGSLVRQNPRAPAQRVLGSMRHPDDPVVDQLYFRSVIGRLWAVGVPVSTEKLWPVPRRRVPLPTYAFQHGRYWIEPGIGQQVADDDDARPERIENVADWFRAPRWIQQGVVDLDEDLHTWLVFLTDEPVATGAVDLLRQAGHRVVCVRAGDAFSRVDSETYTIAPEAGGAGYEELVEALEAADLLPDRILHTWLLTWAQSYRPGSTFFHRNQEYGFYSLFHLARALGRASALDSSLHMIVVANGSQGVAEGAAVYPDKATALGPCSVIPREFPAVSCRFVDLDPGAPVEGRRGRKRDAAGLEEALERSAVEALGEELASAPSNGVVGWRNGVRWERHLRRMQPPDQTQAPRLRDEGVYLITGGFGGIAGVVAEWLARTYRARLILLGRTPLPAREDWDDWIGRNGLDDSISQAILRVRTLEDLGAVVLPVAADVTIAEQMSDVLEGARREFGAVHGVFHAAGVLRDNLILLKSQREIEEVMAAKVYGTLVLDGLFAEQKLDFMVLFSSTSLYVAPQGQVDYVGANAFLNAFATSVNPERSFPVTALNWGIWRDVGMVGQGSAETVVEDPGTATEHVCDHPLFDLRYAARAGTRRIETFVGRLDARNDWVVDEHRLAGGAALLPGTGYLELVRAALDIIAPGHRWRLDNLVFEDALFVADDEPRPFRLRLEERGRQWSMTLLAGAGGDGERWSSCARAKVDVVDDVDTAPPQLEAVQARFASVGAESASGSGHLRTRQEAHLRFGPRWHVLRRLRCGDGEALAELRLADEFREDLSTYAIHPGMLDIATGCAMDLIPGYAEQETAENLWVPLSYGSFRFRAPLTQSLTSWIRVAPASSVASGFAAFDVTLFGSDGSVVAEVQSLTLRRMDAALGVSAPGSDSASSEVDRALSPAERALEHNRSQGITAAEGMSALGVLLHGSPAAEIMVSSMNPADLVRQAEAISRAAVGGGEARFARPELDNEFEAPRNDAERAIADLWGKLLGVEGVGIHDSFFDLGGHSLIAVRFFNEVNDRFGVDLPMSVLMQRPTIAGLSELIGVDTDSPAEDTGTVGSVPVGLEYEFLVPMHAGPVKDAAPLFVVAGMFGNVLNLSHLAHLLGEERPFYAVQARGLYGDRPPHETFEEMAADYLQEVRRVQPHGPYLLGGFSGGGIAAFEMARQLIEAGEEVTSVILLDTPIRNDRHFSFPDRVSMALQGVRRGGLSFLVEKVRSRIAWERERRQGRGAGFPEFQAAESAVSFQSEQIGAAFLRALERYRVPTVDVHVDLFRPRLDVRFELSRGRRVDGQREYVREDNFWTPYVSSIGVHEVPGNHDSMVLEPNVRVLVSSIRRALEKAGSSPSRNPVFPTDPEPRTEAHEESGAPLRRAG